MAKESINYNYAQINILKIVVGISALWSPIAENHPLYDKMIPIREYDESVIGMRYVGRDADGYGLFEPVPEPEQTETEQTETVAE